MNISTKRKLNHRHREQTCGYQGAGYWGRSGAELGLVDVSFCIQNG